MIEMKTIRDFASDTDEGKLLLAALAVLTSIEQKDIQMCKWGGMVNPDEAFKRVVELANKIFYEEEWMAEEIISNRDDKISKIID
jgi:hypothetical protein